VLLRRWRLHPLLRSYRHLPPLLLPPLLDWLRRAGHLAK
jgi:hypothetical protein